MGEYFDSEGNATAEFQTALPGMLGRDNMNNEDGTPDKTFEGITSLKSLVQNVHGLKKLTGEQGTKLEKAMFAPADDASPEDKAAFRASQLTALGHPAVAADYTFPDPPDGREYGEGEKEKWAAFAHEKGVPQDIFTAFVEARHAEILAGDAAAETADAEALTKGIEALDANPEWLGDKKAENLRTIYNTVQAFGDEDLKGKIKEAGLFDKIDLVEWTKLVGIGSLPFLLNVGRKMAVGAKALPAGEKITTEQKDADAKEMYPNSPEMFEN